MRIFTAVRHSIDPRHFYGGLWSGNFYPALRRMEHEIVESEVDLLPASAFMTLADGFDAKQKEIRAKISDQILDEIKCAHQKRPLDLCLFYFYNSHFDPQAFKEIHALGIQTINFFCNSIYQFELVAGIARVSTYSWHAERDARSSYLAIGANPVWVQMAADPKVYHPVDSGPRSPKSVFVGMNYADRADLMAALVRADVPVDIYGPGWGSGNEDRLGTVPPSTANLSSYIQEVWQCVKKEGLNSPLRLLRRWGARKARRQLMPLFAAHAKGPVPFTQVAEIFSSYELCLNFSNVWSDGRPGSHLIPHVRLRDFEAPMSRACYLTGHTEEIAEFYEVGKEIDTYASKNELVEKARFYLGNPGTAERMREAGYRRALRDHTWDRRFEQLFAKIGITSNV